MNKDTMNTLGTLAAGAVRKPRFGQEFSDSDALEELIEILREPFESNCDKCQGSGQHQNASCVVCDGTGVIRIDFL